MFALIKIEWLKIKKYPAFWWMLGFVILAYPGFTAIGYQAFKEGTGKKDMVGAATKMLLGSPFGFPEVWQTVAFFSSLFVLLPSILVIMLVTNEYTYKTHRQNVIDGWSRAQFMTSKLFDVLIVSIVATIAYAAVALICGLITDPDNTGMWAMKLQFIPLFLLQTFAQLSIAFLLGYLVKKAFIALGIFLFYYLIVENIAVGYSYWKLNDIGKFLPFEISDRLIPPPSFWGKIKGEAAYKAAMDAIPQHILLTVLLTALIWFICYKVHKKKEL
jgi:ABC-2 type transport system permease protein